MWTMELEVLAQLNTSIPIQAAHAAAIRNLITGGERYSNHAFDVRSAARSALTRTEVQPHEEKWVAAMLGSGAISMRRTA